MAPLDVGEPRCSATSGRASGAVGPAGDPDLDALPPTTWAILDQLPQLNIFRMVAHAASASSAAMGLAKALLGDLQLAGDLRELAELGVAGRAGARRHLRPPVPREIVELLLVVGVYTFASRTTTALYLDADRDEGAAAVSFART